MCLIFLPLAVRIESGLAWLEPVAKIQPVFFDHLLSTIFTTLSQHRGIKKYTHFANM